jgi:hypothetical protein
MKAIRLLATSLLTSLMLSTSAWAAAAGGTKVYNSGILVLAFVGLCALVVVVQLIPAVITVWGALKSFMEESKKEKMAMAAKK